MQGEDARGFIMSHDAIKEFIDGCITTINMKVYLERHLITDTNITRLILLMCIVYQI